MKIRNLIMPLGTSGKNALISGPARLGLFTIAISSLVLSVPLGTADQGQPLQLQSAKYPEPRRAGYPQETPRFPPPSPMVTRSAKPKSCGVKSAIAREISERGGDWKLMGKMEILSSDMVELEGGEFERQTVLRSSLNAGLVLVVERFDSTGQFAHSSFHSAERLIIRMPDKFRMEGLRTHLSALGFTSSRPEKWHDLLEVKIPPSPASIFASREAIQSVVGSSGSVFFAGLTPK
jgi:hypothetical protein